jgi:uncharacterized protein YnzC (UPF0291/DUF896 family)
MEKILIDRREACQQQIELIEVIDPSGTVARR